MIRKSFFSRTQVGFETSILLFPKLLRLDKELCMNLPSTETRFYSLLHGSPEEANDERKHDFRQRKIMHVAENSVELHERSFQKDHSTKALNMVKKICSHSGYRRWSMRRYHFEESSSPSPILMTTRNDETPRLCCCRFWSTESFFVACSRLNHGFLCRELRYLVSLRSSYTVTCAQGISLFCLFFSFQTPFISILLTNAQYWAALFCLW
jgi:hypothetical protein